MTLRADHSFSIDMVPQQIFALYSDPHFGERVSWSEATSLSGTWTIDIKRKRLTLVVSAAANYRGGAFPLSVGNRSHQLALWTSFGDPDGFGSFQWVKAL